MALICWHHSFKITSKIGKNNRKFLKSVLNQTKKFSKFVPVSLVWLMQMSTIWWMAGHQGANTACDNMITTRQSSRDYAVLVKPQWWSQSGYNNPQGGPGARQCFSQSEARVWHMWPIRGQGWVSTALWETRQTLPACSQKAVSSIPESFRGLS